ncbi:hypothetical protein AVEN_42116-1 [Araneus ventricosus]|uniref:Uncharacterized protein n=1 Tax=Araneus ventricosus TaxID=182803 RepID=A0A4Y2D407_ARAVE|nr:hypothetical protein AVEN_42116-1 [Araneus ventricosus]
MILRATGPIHGGSSVESGLGPGALRPQGPDLTIRPPRPFESLTLTFDVREIFRYTNKKRSKGASLTSLGIGYRLTHDCFAHGSFCETLDEKFPVVIGPSEDMIIEE